MKNKKLKLSFEDRVTIQNGFHFEYEGVCPKLCIPREVVSYWKSETLRTVDHAAGEFTQVLFEDVASSRTLPLFVCA